MSESLLLTLQHHVKYVCEGHSLYLVWLGPLQPGMCELRSSVWWYWRRWDLLVNITIDRAVHGSGNRPVLIPARVSLQLAFLCSLLHKQEVWRCDLYHSGSGKTDSSNSTGAVTEVNQESLRIKILLLWRCVWFWSFPLFLILCIHDTVMLSALRL